MDEQPNLTDQQKGFAAHWRAEMIRLLGGDTTVKPLEETDVRDCSVEQYAKVVAAHEAQLEGYRQRNSAAPASFGDYLMAKYAPAVGHTGETREVGK